MKIQRTFLLPVVIKKNKILKISILNTRFECSSKLEDFVLESLNLVVSSMYCLLD